MASHAKRHLRLLAAERAEVLVHPGERFAVYTCPAGHQTLTAVIDSGNLPDTLGCRHEPDHCGEQGTRATDGTDIPGHLHPARWEWHKPTAEQLSRFRRAGGPLWLHVNRGGLVLRRRRQGSP